MHVEGWTMLKNGIAPSFGQMTIGSAPDIRTPLPLAANEPGRSVTEPSHVTQLWC